MSSKYEVDKLASLINKGIENSLKDLHTTSVGIIKSFDPVTQTASVQPAIKRVFISDDGDKQILIPKDLPLLINVPVVFQRGGGFSMTFPVNIGDECKLDFLERSIDIWHSTGEVSLPGARRFHSLSDAVATVGLSSIPNKIPDFDPDNIVIKKDDLSVYISINKDSSMEIYSDSNMTVTSKANVTLNVTGDLTINSDGPTLVKSEDIKLDGSVVITGDLKVEGSTSLTTDVTSAGANIGNKHKHAGPITAPSGPVSPTGIVS